MFVVKLADGFGVEDEFARQQVIAERANRIDVAPWIAAGRVVDRFGRHEQRCPLRPVPTDQTRKVAAAVAVFADQTKIEHLHAVRHAAAVAEENIRRFDVAMHQTEGMRLGQRIADLREDVDHAAFGLRTKPRDQLV